MPDTSRRGRRPLTHPARAAAFIYTGISVTGSILFILVTTFTGDYPLVARYGGAAWVFLLLMIVLMPIVIPRVQRWGGKRSGPMGGTPEACTLPQAQAEAEADAEPETQQP